MSSVLRSAAGGYYFVTDKLMASFEHNSTVFLFLANLTRLLAKTSAQVTFKRTVDVIKKERKKNKTEKNI